MKRLLKILGILGCIAYLLNPGAGIFEIIPDALPFIGNLDEGAAGTALVLLIQSLRKKGSAEDDEDVIDVESSTDGDDH